MSTPPQLKQDGIRLTKLKAKSKKLLEQGGLENSYLLADIEQHVHNGGNYGVIGGHGGLIILDSDSEELEAVAQKVLPPTFTVKTPGKGFHRYYYCPEMQNTSKLPLKKEGTHYGDLIVRGGYVVGPGSVHPDTGTRYEVSKDQEIAEISKECLYAALMPYIKVNYQHSVSSKDCYSLSITDVLNEYGINLKSTGSGLAGPHPVHGSSNGNNFSVSPDKNAWHCFRCDSGGGPLQLIAVMEGKLDCSESKKGALRGETFKEIARIAEEKFGVKILKSQTSQDLDRILESSELDAVVGRVQAIPSDTDKKALPALLEGILDELARIAPTQAEAILQNDLKSHFSLKANELETYSKRVKLKRKRLLEIDTEDTICSEDLMERLEATQSVKDVHPAIDFVGNKMYFGLLTQGGVVLVSSERKLINVKKGGYIE